MEKNWIHTWSVRGVWQLSCTGVCEFQLGDALQSKYVLLEEHSVTPERYVAGLDEPRKGKINAQKVVVTET